MSSKELDCSALTARVVAAPLAVTSVHDVWAGDYYGLADADAVWRML